ncbi:flap endonuclease-1, partial [Nanoarchaeota archaeon]
MGVKLFDLIPVKEIRFEDMAGKIIVVDGNLNLYQFLSSIRQKDGTLLMDSKGNITSHLTGLFMRSARLMRYGIKLCYVFDGKAPDLKKKEQMRRRELKEEAATKYKEAEKSGDVAGMKKYASRTTKLTPQMVEEAKELISALGLPVVHAPSEGEAQAAHMVRNGHAYAVGSQDADSFLFGATRVIKNLTISPRKKKPGQFAYREVKPEMIILENILNELGLDQNQLIALAMLVGTDYNPGGIKGIGPKNALKLVKKYGADLDALFLEVKWGETFSFNWTDVFYQIKKID